VSYLLDTDTCSAHLRENPAVTGRILKYSGRICLSMISVGELMTWALRKTASPRRLQGVQELMRDATLLDVTEDVANRFGLLRAQLLDAGRPTPDMDLWIAATAIVHDLVLVTHNTQDFAHVPGLHLDDWLTS
jgi:tRNA(fMet)-specific endonuclease VapC